jgi:hypothetical protein
MSLLDRLRGWWRRPAEPTLPDPRRALIHWSPEQTGMPLCQARLGSRWTIERQHATCDACRQAGWFIEVQWRCNTR